MEILLDLLALFQSLLSFLVIPLLYLFKKFIQLLEPSDKLIYEFEDEENPYSRTNNER